MGEEMRIYAIIVLEVNGMSWRFRVKTGGNGGIVGVK